MEDTKTELNQEPEKIYTLRLVANPQWYDYMHGIFLTSTDPELKSGSVNLVDGGGQVVSFNGKGKFKLDKIKKVLSIYDLRQFYWSEDETDDNKGIKCDDFEISFEIIKERTQLQDNAYGWKNDSYLGVTFLTFEEKYLFKFDPFDLCGTNRQNNLMFILREIETDDYKKDLVKLSERTFFDLSKQIVKTREELLNSGIKFGQYDHKYSIYRIQNKRRDNESILFNDFDKYLSIEQSQKVKENINKYKEIANEIQENNRKNNVFEYYSYELVCSYEDSKFLGFILFSIKQLDDTTYVYIKDMFVPESLHDKINDQIRNELENHRTCKNEILIVNKEHANIYKNTFKNIYTENLNITLPMDVNKEKMLLNDKDVSYFNIK